MFIDLLMKNYKILTFRIAIYILIKLRDLIFYFPRLILGVLIIYKYCIALIYIYIYNFNKILINPKGR